MKIRSVIFIVVCFLSSLPALAQKKILIQGALSNSGSDKITLTTKNLIDNKTYQIAETKVDSSGYFILVVDCLKPMQTSINYKGQDLPLFFEPGDSLWVRGDALKLRSTVKYEGRGSKANRFLLDYDKKYFRDGTLANTVMKAYRERNANGFMWTTDSLRENMLSFYTDYYPETMNNAFDSWIRNEIRSHMAWAKWDYILYHFPFDLTYNGFDIDSADFKIGDEIRILNPSGLNSATYAGFITQYFIELKRHLSQRGAQIKKGEDPVPEIADVFEFLRDELDIETSMQFMTSARFLAKCAATGLDLKSLHLQLARFKAMQADTSYTSPIDRLIQEPKNYLLKELNITDTLARKFKSEDFDGKVVYVKYWATWNKASMQELTQCLQLEERMKGSDIRFIYVNLDPEISIWYTVLAERNLKGNHYRYEELEPESLWDLFLKFKYSPHNQIYGRDGKIKDIWAAPPSSGAEQRLNEIK